MKNHIRYILWALLTGASQFAIAECPAWMNHSFRLLHSPDSKNLCTSYAGKPMLLVNTASHCGFTPQFDGLEALYKRYKDKGLVVAGFLSNDFHQEEAAEEGAAKVCYVNYGVTFDMFAPSHVRGADANPVFAELGKAQGAPKWNFYKYLIDRNGKIVAKFASTTAPDDAKLVAAIEALVATP